MREEEEDTQGKATCRGRRRGPGSLPTPRARPPGLQNNNDVRPCWCRPVTGGHGPQKRTHLPHRGVNSWSPETLCSCRVPSPHRAGRLDGAAHSTARLPGGARGERVRQGPGLPDACGGQDAVVRPRSGSPVARAGQDTLIGVPKPHALGQTAGGPTEGFYDHIRAYTCQGVRKACGHEV